MTLPRPSSLLRVVLSLFVSLAIAWLLHRRLGWNPSPLTVSLRHFPSVARHLPDGVVHVLHPRWLWGLVAAPYFSLMAGYSLADLAWPQRALGVIVRAVLCATVLLALARPTATARSHRVCTVFLVDVSDSIGDDTLGDFRTAVASAVRARGDNLVRLVTFARRPRVVPLPDTLPAGVHLPDFSRHNLSPGVALSPGSSRTDAGAGTDIAAAVSLAYGLFPPGYLRRMVLLSDGVQTDGDALAEVSRATRFGVRLSTLASHRPPPAEVAIRELRLPEHLRVDEPFDVHATVFSSRPERAEFTLLQGEALNGLNGTRTVDLSPGSNDLRFRSVVRVPGDVTYTLRVRPAGGDRFSENNRYVTTATVPGRPAVLYVEGDPSHAEYFRSALSGGDFDVETRPATEFPQTVREMERFDFIVLSDVGAESVSQGAQDALGSYLRDLGGGFMMAGGARGFGLGGWQGTAMERLLPVRMESERHRDEPSVALVLVIDRSGSMQGRPLELAQSAAVATAQALGPDDLLEVIAFDSLPERVVRMQPARNRARIENDIRRLRPGGGTAIFPAVDAAAQDLAVTRAANRHVILLTDGQGQPDEPPHIVTLVDGMSADGITVSAVGMGTQVDRPLLERIAQRGHGRSYFTADAGNLPQIFLRETSLVARSAAVEALVTPQIVSPAGFLREAEGGPLPSLYGYVSTRARPEPAQVLIQSDGSPPEPLLARWHVGLGWSLAWTSDLKNRWAVQWIHWPRWRAFWTQLVREHMRQHRRHELGMQAEMLGGDVHVSVDAITPDDRFDDGLSSELTLRGPQPGGTEEHFPLHQVAPGRYEATFPLERYGAFTLHAVHRRDGVSVAESNGRVDNPYPREYAVVTPDLALLTTLAASTGGVYNPAPETVWNAHGESILHPLPLWRYPVGATVGLLLLDVLLRRVRFLDRGVGKKVSAA